MAISVVCSGCQSQYSVPDNMAGKRAKCKKCGAVLVMPSPAPSGSTDLFADLGSSSSDASSGDLFGDLAPSTPSRPPPKKPSSSGGLFGDLDSGDDSYQLQETSPSDLLSMGGSAAAPKSRPLYGAAPGSSRRTFASGAVTAVLSLCAATVMFFIMLCTGDFRLALLVGFLGMLAAMGGVALGWFGKPGLSWSLCGLYGAICLLGLVKAAYNVTRFVSGDRPVAATHRPHVSHAPPYQPQPRRPWPSPAGTTPTNASVGPITPLTPRPGGNPVRPDIKPWSPSDPQAEELAQPRTDNWSVAIDPVPDWAKVGEGREFSMLLDEPGFTPVRYADGYARAIAFEHRLGGQDVFEVWDLGQRKKVGQLKGRNAFQGDVSLSPDGRYVAGEVRPEHGASFHGPIQVWSLAQSQKVCEIPPPGADRRVELLDYSGPETLLAIYRRNDRYALGQWNIADGSPKGQTIDLGEHRIDGRHYVLSPGRKYFAAWHEQVIEFYDLTTGSAAGRINLPSRVRCEAVTFSPDGSELAALCDSNSKAQILLWQTQTGEFKVRVPLSLPLHEVLNGHEKTGGLPLGWLGNGEGWLVGGRRVVARKDGATLWTLPQSPGLDQPAKLLDADQLITVERNGAMTRVSLRPFPFGEMDSVNKALAAGGAAIDARLPPLGKPDWSQVQELTWQVGATWSVAVDARSPMKSGAGNRPISVTAERLAGIEFGDPAQAQAVVLDVDRRSPEHTELSTSVSSYLARYDLVSGKSAARQKVPGGSRLLAASPSGQRAVTTIGTDEGRIDLYALGETPPHVCAWRPYLDENPKVESQAQQKQFSRQSILWAGFVGEDHLLTMNRFDGQLVLWKVPEMKAVYRLRTGSGSRPALSPTGKYLVVRTLGRLALLDAKTGRNCGELPIPFDPPRPDDTSVCFSADGTRLAATVPDFAGAFLLAYDLKTGKETARMPLSQDGRMQWCGARQLMIGGQRATGGDVRLIDLDRRAVVWRYNVFSGYRLPDSPDDRVWLIAGGYGEAESILVAQPFQLTNEVTTAINSLPMNPPPLFGPGTTVALDTAGVGNAGSPDIAERTRKLWSTHLAARGVRIGEGGMRLVASTSSGESRTEEYTPSRLGIPFPHRQPNAPQQGNFSFTTTDINLEVKLLDANGTAHWQTRSVARYHLPSSIYANTDQKSPQQVLAEGQSAAHRGSVDGFFASIRLPYMIYAQPVDKDGRPGLGTTPINLSGYVRQQPAGRRPVTNETASAKEATQQMYAKALAENPAVNNEYWQWCAGLDRPVVAVRWGVGVQMDLSGDRAKQELQPEPVNPILLRDLERVAGPIGPLLVQQLRARQSEGKCGTFADIADDKLREVVLLGSGERAQLATAARKALVDVVLIIKLEPVAKGRQRDKQLSLEVLDLASAKRMWTSEALLESRTHAAKARGEDLLEQLSQKFSEEMDARLTLEPLANMPTTKALARADGGTLHRANPLASLAEVDLYLCREKIPATIAMTAFAKILGNTADAAALASDTAAVRDAALAKIVPQLAQKLE